MTSDEALYERLLDGNMRAFDALYERYERRLFGFIRRYVPDTAQAEEIFHEAFLAVLRERRKGQALTSFKPWLFKVTRNLCLNYLRGQDRAARAIEKLGHEPPAADAGPESCLSRAETAAALQRAVAQLPEPLGEMYAMRAAGMSYEGVAEVLGIPIGTVKSRMNTMLERLRKEMTT